MVLNKWIPCSDDNYWSEEDDYVTIVKYSWGSQTWVFVRENCPYGWNILIHGKAELMNIKL